jgi:hypothetical protein
MKIFKFFMGFMIVAVLAIFAVSCNKNEGGLEPATSTGKGKYAKQLIENEVTYENLEFPREEISEEPAQDRAADFKISTVKTDTIVSTGTVGNPNGSSFCGKYVGKAMLKTWGQDQVFNLVGKGFTKSGVTITAKIKDVEIPSTTNVVNDSVATVTLTAYNPNGADSTIVKTGTLKFIMEQAATATQASIIVSRSISFVGCVRHPDPANANRFHYGNSRFFAMSERNLIYSGNWNTWGTISAIATISNSTYVPELGDVVGSSTENIRTGVVTGVNKTRKKTLFKVEEADYNCTGKKKSVTYKLENGVISHATESFPWNTMTRKAS